MRRLLKNSRFWLIVKVLLTLGFIFHFATKWEEFDVELLRSTWDRAVDHNLWLFGILFFSMFIVNWLTDTQLWWLAVRSQTHISFKEAFKINLISHAVGLVTPANLGEYGIKALHFTELGKKKQSVLLTISYRWAKWFVKSGFGLLAGYMIWKSNRPELAWACLAILVLLAISYAFLPRILDALYHGKIGRFLFDDKEVTDWNFKNNYFWRALSVACLKFSSYTLQLAILLHLGSELSLFDGFWRSSAIYSLSSFIPTLSLFDPMVKAGIGELVIPQEMVSIAWIAVSTFLVWLTNLGLPSAVGYVLWWRMKSN